MQVYGRQHYIAVMLFLARLYNCGYSILGAYHSSCGGEVALIPHQFADLTVFARDREGKSCLFVYQYDSVIHAQDVHAGGGLERDYHERDCPLFTVG